jgi:hypothetical protein
MDALSKLLARTMEKVGSEAAGDMELDFDRLLSEPIDPELRALAEQACEEQKRDDEYLASLSPEEREQVQKERIEKMAKWMVETPFYEAELLGICKAEDVK